MIDTRLENQIEQLFRDLEASNASNDEMYDRINAIYAFLSEKEKEIYDKYEYYINRAARYELRILKAMVQEQAKDYANWSQEINDLRRNYYSNIIATMGVFLTIFALIIGNLQIFQALVVESLARTVLFLLLAEIFLVICIFALIIGIGFLTHNERIINNINKFLRAIFCLFLLVPLFIYAYHYREFFLGLHWGFVVFLCVGAVLWILVKIAGSNSRK